MKKVTRQRTVVQDYNVYIAKDGKEFTSESECEHHEKLLDGTRIVCPECGGKKGWEGRWIPPYDNYDIGHVEGHYEWNTCPKCKGKGYLEKKVTWE